MNKLNMDREINHLAVCLFFSFVTVILWKKAIIFCANGSVLLEKTYMLSTMYGKLHLFSAFFLANNFLQKCQKCGPRYKYLHFQSVTLEKESSRSSSKVLAIICLSCAFIHGTK